MSTSERFQSLSDDDARQLTEHLAVLTKSGLPLGPALRAVAEEDPNHRLAAAALLVSRELDAGRSLSDIFEKNPQFLPRHVQQLVITGIQSSNLPQVLVQLVEIDRKAADLKRGAWRAVAYPVLLLSMCALLLVFFSLWVMPDLIRVYKEYGTAMPLPTRILTSISGDVALRGFAVFVAAASMIFITLRVSLRPQGWQRMWMRFPLLGQTLQWRGVANWSRLLALLLKQNIPLPAAAKLAAEGVYAPLMAVNGLRIAAMTSDGRKLSDAMSLISIFPATMAPLIRWGEEHGALAEALDAAAEMFETRVRLRTAFVQSILPPITFVIISIGILAVAASVIGPLVGMIQDLGSISRFSRSTSLLTRSEIEEMGLKATGVLALVWLAMCGMLWFRGFALGSFLAELMGFSRGRRSKLKSILIGLLRFDCWATGFALLMAILGGLTGSWSQIDAIVNGGNAWWVSLSSIVLGVASTFALVLWLAAIFIAITTKIRYSEMERRSLLWMLAVAAEKGVPLPDAVRAFGAERQDKLGDRTQRLAFSLEQGMRLDAALSDAGISLPNDAIVAVRTGSDNGALAELLKSSAQQAAHLNAPVNAAIGRLLYLIVFTVFAFFVVAFLAINIVPAYVKIFRDFHTDLPNITLWFMNAIHFFVRIPGAIFLLALGLLFVLGYSLVRYSGLWKWELPVVRRWSLPLDASVVLRALAKSVEHHSPLGKTLISLSVKYPKPHIRKQLAQACEQIDQGANWCESLQHSGIISAAEAGVLKSAERVGNLVWALEEMANRLGRKFVSRLTGWLAIGFPLVMILFGGAVLIISAGMIYPLVCLISRMT